MKFQVPETENNNKKSRLIFKKFLWRINNFSEVNRGRFCSGKYILDDIGCYITIYPNQDIQDYLEIYLQADMNCANLPKDGKKPAHFNLALVNQVNDKMSITKGYEFEFSSNVSYWALDGTLTFNDLYKPSCGFIVNDTVMIEVEIFTTKYVYENEEYQPVCKIDDNHNNPLLHKMFTSSFENIEQTFIPLIEEVCLQHPSLILSQEKRSIRFSEWAFTALGRVLYFLKTKKVKDMNDEACNHLQILWDELKTCGFDLTWLEVHVESALNAKRSKENVDWIRKNVSDLKLRTEKLKAKWIRREKELGMAIMKLKKAEERFEESIWISD
ncbi:MATH domain and coiled-coil domain-containing protein At3g58340 isoform X1 [Vigna unguiculata]|uniref:Ubiquitin carboxyl-terminal hydrolase 7 n=1 Tax=Vigna unguiculata TaxID=3917 RepID=A0A4D6MQ59_VIGUN|nr:MATH domain and coiled-coil domain-containing protein At3g58340 isoform X1 [Vigna unguiculata]QCE02742.1 ubiquitin carboxyl-terminal hydrolase 7 [Vigna unguiculata]